MLGRRWRSRSGTCDLVSGTGRWEKRGLGTTPCKNVIGAPLMQKSIGEPKSFTKRVCRKNLQKLERPSGARSEGLYSRRSTKFCGYRPR